MSKLIFKPLDFIHPNKPYHTQAQEIHDRWLSENSIKVFSDSKMDVWTSECTGGVDTYHAKLVNIEELPKKPCQHEPISIFLDSTLKVVVGHKCKGCGVELVANWSEKK